MAFYDSDQLGMRVIEDNTTLKPQIKVVLSIRLVYIIRPNYTNHHR